MIIIRKFRFSFNFRFAIRKILSALKVAEFGQLELEAESYLSLLWFIKGARKLMRLEYLHIFAFFLAPPAFNDTRNVSRNLFHSAFAAFSAK